MQNWPAAGGAPCSAQPAEAIQQAFDADLEPTAAAVPVPARHGPCQTSHTLPFTTPVPSAHVKPACPWGGNCVPTLTEGTGLQPLLGHSSGICTGAWAPSP